MASKTGPPADKRTRLMQAAITLVYRQGFGRTSLADIAKEAKVPLGNVYYYFKSKDDIAEAIIEQYVAMFGAMCGQLNTLDSPCERLCAFVQLTADNRELLAESGCPLGTLCSELRKEAGPLGRKSAQLFAEQLRWLEGQFRELGEKSEARGLAVHLLAALQGIRMLAHALSSAELVVPETERLKTWIRTL